MKEMLGVLKAGPPTSTADLSSIKKTLIADSLRKRFGLSALLERLGLKRSGYYPAKTRLARPDRHAGLARLIVQDIRVNEARYGYRRIWLVLPNVCGITCSKKLERPCPYG
jgi:hypothetical protein